VQVTLTPQQQMGLTSTSSVNVEAYDAYLMGRYLWNKRTADGFQKAIEYFQTAIGKDPSYAAAYAGLADCYLVWRGDQPRQAMQVARTAALKALEIDPDLAEAHSTLAGVKLRYDLDWRGAEEEQQRAIALNPNYATAHQRYSQLWSAKKRVVLKRPPLPGDTHDVSRQAQTSSRRGNRLASRACGRSPEPRSGWVPASQDLMTSEAGPGCNGLPTL
jgi:tetratricopeptide (TPR) repeat protein